MPTSYEAEREAAFKRIFEKYHLARKRRQMMEQWRKENPPPIDATQQTPGA
jgi:hypothetical protein